MGCNCKKTVSAPRPSKNTVKGGAPSTNGKRNGRIIRRIIK